MKKYLHEKNMKPLKNALQTFGIEKIFAYWKNIYMIYGNILVCSLSYVSDCLPSRNNHGIE